MNIYIKGYIHRWCRIVVTIISFIAAMILSGILFYGKLNKLSCQLDTYIYADYSVIYILNYSAHLPNECIFPDTDVQLFLNDARQKRMTVSSIMREDGTRYNLDYLQELKKIRPDEIIISKNVADNYGLQVGSEVYAEFPYSSDLIKLTVSEIMDVNYDHAYPNIDNDIGIVYLGYINDYENNLQCKYIEFANHSESDALSNYPQIIDSVINKIDNINFVMKQGLVALIFQAIFCGVAVFVGHIGLFSKSELLLRRCYLKGMKRRQMVSILLTERIVFGLIPGIIISHVFLAIIPGRNQLRLAYSLLPSILWGIYCVIMLCIDMMKIRKKRS